MQNFRLIREAVTTVGTDLTFSENDNGDALVAIFAATAVSADFGNLPATLMDTNGNVWTLTQKALNQANAVSGYNGFGVYVCSRCIATVTNILDLPNGTWPADVSAKWAYGAEFSSTFAYLTANAGFVAYTGKVANYVMDIGSVFTDSTLLLGLSVDASLTEAPLFTTNLQGFDANGNSDSIGGYNISTLPEPQATTTDVNIQSATDVFGFLMALQGTNSQGASAQTSASFFVNKGPNPTVPNEGRAIATVEIDCSNMPLIPTPLNYDEFSTNNYNCDGAVVVEFDLQRLNMASSQGLSDCKAMAFYFRPCYKNGEDLQYNNEYFPALVTNLTTRQTVICWGINTQFAGGYETSCMNPISQGVVPFPANVNAMKIRVIIPQAYDAPQGKLTLQFFNFDVPPYGPIGVGMNIND